MDKEMNMDSQTWYIVRTTHESGQRVESRRFGIDAVDRYIDRCIAGLWAGVGYAVYR